MSEKKRVRLVLAELEAIASKRVRIARRAISEGIAPCEWCAREMPVAELEVDDDFGGVSCLDVDACCDAAKERKPGERERTSGTR